MKRYKLKPFGI